MVQFQKEAISFISTIPHWVRDEDELARIVTYINANPVKAGLIDKPYQYLWCSAHDRYLYDGDESGWLGFDRNGAGNDATVSS